MIFNPLLKKSFQKIKDVFSWSEITDKPDVYPPEEHEHLVADITDMPVIPNPDEIISGDIIIAYQFGRGSTIELNNITEIKQTFIGKGLFVDGLSSAGLVSVQPNINIYIYEGLKLVKTVPYTIENIGSTPLQSAIFGCFLKFYFKKDVTYSLVVNGATSFDKIFLFSQSPYYFDSIAYFDESQTYIDDILQTGRNFFSMTVGEISQMLATDSKIESTVPIYAPALIVGDIYQSGDSYETHAEQVYSEKDNIILREGAIAGLLPSEFTGLIAKLYDGVNDGSLVFDNEGWARVGDVGSLQKLATIEETPIDNYFAKWNNTNLRFETVDLLTAIKSIDGVGSGLDADFLQGKPYENLLQSVDENGKKFKFDKNAFIGLNAYYSAGWKAKYTQEGAFAIRNSGDGAGLQFYVQDGQVTADTDFLFNTYSFRDGDIFIGNSKFWNENNDGEGSGLNADLLDDLQKGQTGTNYIPYVNENGRIGIGTNNPKSKLHVVGLNEYADNADALTAGLTAGAFYRTGDILKVVH